MSDDNSLNIKLTATLKDFEADMARATKGAVDGMTKIDAKADATSGKVTDAFGKAGNAARSGGDAIAKSSAAAAQGFGASVDRIIAKTNQANKELTGLKSQMMGVMGQFQSGQTQSLAGLGNMLSQAGSLKNFAALAGGPVGVAALVGGTAYSELKQFAAIGDLADKARASAQAVQGFGVTMGKLGVDTTSANGILSTFADKLANARQFGGAFKTELEGMGVALTNADGSARSAVEILGDFASRIKNTADESEKMRLATLAVGDQLAGPFLQAVNASKTGLADLASVSAQAGSSLTNDLAKGAQLAMGALDDLGKRADGVYAQIKRLIGVANEIDRLKAAQEDTRQIRDQGDALAREKGSPQYVDGNGIVRGGALASQENIDRSALDYQKALFAEQQLDGTKERADALKRALEKSAAKNYGPQLPAGGMPDSDDDYTSTEKGSGRGGRGGSQAQERDRAADVISALQEELGITNSIADGQGTIAMKQREIAELKRAGVTADSDEGKEITGLVQKLDAAKEKAKLYQEALGQAKQVTASIASGIDSWIVKGNKFGNAMRGVLQSIESQLLKLALTGADGKGGLLGPLTSSLTGGFSALTGGGLGFADGGYVSGPGSARSDSIPASLSNGEFVVNAASTARFLPILHAINAGKVPRFADGGQVGSVSAPKIATATPGGSSVTTIAPQITVQAQGGTPDQNADLARQVGRHVESNLRGLVISELQKQLRPGNMLYR